MRDSFLIAQSVSCHFEVFFTIQNRTSVVSLKMKVSFNNYIQQARLLFETPPYPPQTHKYNFKAGELLQMYKPTSNSSAG